MPRLAAFLIAMLPALASAQGVVPTVKTSDVNGAAFSGVVAMTIGTTYAAGRSIKINATAAGTFVCTLPDATTTVLGFQSNAIPPWTQVLPFACVSVSSVTGAATFEVLK